MNESYAYFILNLVPGVGPVTVKKLLEAFGTTVNILNVTRTELDNIQGLRKKQIDALLDWKTVTDYEEEFERCEKAEITLVTPADSTYPSLLLQTYDPPLCLYVRGNVNALSGRNIAFVGSRKTSFYGVNVTKDFASSAVNCGWTIVSGLARGIDTVAHQTAVDCKGLTVAVIGSGLARLYPQENLNLAREIIKQGGAIISEFPLNAPPDRRSFPMRNRIVAGMSSGTLVVEGGVKSGSMITATHTMEQGKPVFAVPGMVTNPQARGCHQLIKNGAKLVESFYDIMEEFSEQPSLPFDNSPNPRKVQDCIEIPLNVLEKKIVEIMKRGLKPMSADEISEYTEIEMGQILSTIMVLEMKKVVVQSQGMCFSLATKVLNS